MTNYPRRNNPKNNNRNANRGPTRGSGRRPGQQSHHRPAPKRVVSADEAKFLSGIPVDPYPRILLEEGSTELTVRAMDLICPIGKGQRGLIVAPPGSGKTTFLKNICQATAKSSPEIKIYCLLIDERPEEVTEFRRAVPADVRWSSSDHDYAHHIATADAVMQDAFKEVAQGKDVMILIDSLTRLSRVHNAQRSSSGRTLSGGVDARAMEAPRRIFGAARNIEDGGSLTILATILVDTGSRMDEVIFEEFKGTGNMEIVLSRDAANHRIYPAIDVAASNTRRSELLFEKDEYIQVEKLRRYLAGMDALEAARKLVDYLQKNPTNKDLLSTFE
jgi:transcription termination factor Rho